MDNDLDRFEDEGGKWLEPPETWERVASEQEDQATVTGDVEFPTINLPKNNCE